MKKPITTYLFTFLFLIPCTFCFSQKSKIDSLINILSGSKHDTIKVQIYNQLFLESEFNNTEKAKEFLNKSLELARKINYRKGLADTYTHLGFLAEDMGNNSEALKNHLISLKINEAINFTKGIVTSYTNIGICYYSQGNYPAALKNHFEALKRSEAIHDKRNSANSYNNIGVVYYFQGNYSEALKNYLACLKTKEELGDKKGIAVAYNNLGGVSLDQGNYSEALKYHMASLKIKEELGDKQGIAASYNNLGNVYSTLGNREEALKNYFMSLQIKKKLNDKFDIATNYINIGTTLSEQKNYNEAEKYIIKAKKLSLEIGYKTCLKEAYKALTKLDSAKNNFKGAYENHKLYTLFKDSIDNDETKKKTIQNQMTYDFEKKEAATKAAQEKKDAVAFAENRREKVIRYSIIVGLLLMFFVALVIFRSLRITRKQKQIIEQQKQIVDAANNELNQQNEEIKTQRDEIEKQKEEIEIIHEELKDSIHYAQRIQKAVLPTDDFINSILPEHFILFKPKDIVSGDFYWITKRHNVILIAVADCTGHGVPGGFMSMLGISFLNEIIIDDKIKTAGQILDELRNYVVKSLQQKGIEDEQNTSTLISVKDGMDIAFITLNTETNELQFAGANNPLYLVKKLNVESYNVEETKNTLDNSTTLLTLQHYEPARQDHSGGLYELKGDKQPVAIYENMKPFTNHVIQLQKGDTIYLMSDGFEDQFGGPKGKKFYVKNLKELIEKNSTLSMTSQKEFLNQTIEDWIYNYPVKYEQTDDITIMGIKI